MDSFAPADPVQLARIIARGAALGTFGPECAEGAVGPEGAEDLAPLRVLRALPHMTLPAPLFGVIPGEMSPLAYALHVGAPARTLAFLVGECGQDPSVPHCGHRAIAPIHSAIFMLSVASHAAYGLSALAALATPQALQGAPGALCSLLRVVPTHLTVCRRAACLLYARGWRPHPPGRGMDHRRIFIEMLVPAEVGGPQLLPPPVLAATEALLTSADIAAAPFGRGAVIARALRAYRDRDLRAVAVQSALSSRLPPELQERVHEALTLHGDWDDRLLMPPRGALALRERIKARRLAAQQRADD